MKVYIVFERYDYEGATIVSIHRSSETAEIARQERHDLYDWISRPRIYVEEREVDD